MLLLVFATIVAGAFFGAAAYVSLVEHPARVSCGPALALRQFGPSYRRGAVLQASLAILGCLSAIAAGWLLRDPLTAAAGAILGAPVPYTLIVILPTNKRLLDPSLDPESPEATTLLARWARLHAVRTTVGGAAFILLVLRFAAATDMSR